MVFFPGVYINNVLKSNCLISEDIPVGESASIYSKLKSLGNAELNVRNVPPSETLKFVMGSISKLRALKLIFVNRLLAPTVSKDEEATLRPNTSFVAVRLTPSCSMSLRFPPDNINLLLRSNRNLPDIPYLNLLSVNP